MKAISHENMQQVCRWSGIRVVYTPRETDPVSTVVSAGSVRWEEEEEQKKKALLCWLLSLFLSYRCCDAAALGSDRLSVTRRRCYRQAVSSGIFL